MRIIEFFSVAWGGGYNIIVPTDRNTIPHSFWQILDIYDPDYLFFYYQGQQPQRCSSFRGAVVVRRPSAN
jgi:hypothetical protein